MTKLVLLALTTYAFATADTLVLKNGSHLKGVFLGGDSRTVKFEANDHVASYPVADVDSVHFTSGVAPAPVSSTAPVPRPVARPTVQIMANTPITVRLIDAIHSGTAAPGSIYRASVDVPIYSGGRVVIPAYSSVVVQIVDRNASGHMTGNTSLILALTKVEVGGIAYDVSTTDVVEASGNRGSTSAKITGGTAAAGAVLGAIAGGGRGAAIGAGSGAVVGAAASVLRPGQKVNLASETKLTFRLATPLLLSAPSAPSHPGNP
jgi:hypothetical protein